MVSFGSAIAWLLDLLSVALLGMALTTLFWMLHAWSDQDGYRSSVLESEETDSWEFVSLLLPARHEESVLADTVSRIMGFDYPNFELVVVVGHDDEDTMTLAQDLASLWPSSLKVVTDYSWPKSKPRALNTGLKHCSGTVVGVIDAEDDVAPQLLYEVAKCFIDPDISVVQGSVQLVNHRSKWFSLRNCLEYYLWYRSRLIWQVRTGFVPLGGNTVFFRRDAIESSGGWDGDCLTEDCDLGIRMGVAGAQVKVLFSPEITTLEETPLDIRGFIKQRTRWSQGFIQVARKGDWRELPRLGQRLMAAYTLLTPIYQATSFLGYGLLVLGLLQLRMGENRALVLFAPLLALLIITALEAVALSELGREFGMEFTLDDYVWLVLSTVPYMLLLSWAAMRAVTREVRGLRGWEKTAHAGLHRVSDSPELRTRDV